MIEKWFKICPSIRSLPFMLFCFVGCVVHTVIVGRRYFEYPTVSSTSVFLPEMFTPRPITACLYFNDLVDLDRMNKDLGTNYIRENRYQTNFDQDKMTIAQIFNYTTDVSNVLHSVWFKDANREWSYPITGSNIMDVVNITKYAQGEYICYKIALKKAEAMDYLEGALINEEEQLLSSIKFSTAVSDVSVVKFMLTHKSHISSQAFISTKKLWRQLYMDGKAKFNYFYISEHAIELLSLPKPFPANCIDYTKFGFHDRSHCIDDCLANATLQTFGKISLFTPVTKTSHHLSFYLRDLWPNETDHQYRKIRQDCQFKHCKNPDCNQTITVTDQTPDSTRDHERQFVVWTYLSPKLSFKVTLSPEFSEISFILYLMSIVSTWLGLSMLSLDPSRLFEVKKKYTLVIKKELTRERKRVDRSIKQQRELTEGPFLTNWTRTANIQHPGYVHRPILWSQHM